MPPKKAKVVDDTAAAGRPRRNAAVANNAPALATPKKRGQAAAHIKQDAEPPKKRGRPAKATVATETEPEPADAPAEAPKKRGRPSKAAAAAETIDEVAEPPKKRGRAAKVAAVEPETVEEVAAEPTKRGGRSKKQVDASAATATPNKRGRPAKASTAPATDDVEDEKEEKEAVAEPPRKRGRPAKVAAPAVSVEPPPAKRGRPPKGGESTKITSDDAAAADQLEDELVGEASNADPSSKPNENTAEAGKANAGKSFWLMKAEQVDRNETTSSGKVINTKFTIDDLRAKKEPEAWDGVRNLQAAKNMRAMRAGDLAFFYASQGKAGLQPGITGIMEIISEAVPDPTVADPDAYGFVAKESDRDKWCVVHVEFRKKLSPPVSLKELQQYKADTAILGKMQLLKQMRLSVSRVSEEEWNFIVDNLIEGYEENEAVIPATSKDEGANVPASDLPETHAAVESTSTAATGLTNGSAATNDRSELALPTTESDLPDTGAMPAAPATKASAAPSRKSSRAPSASRAANLVATTGAGSRAASLAPSAGRAASRGRSRTPKVRGASAQPEVSNMAAIEE